MFYAQIIKPILDNISKFANKNAFCINEEMITYREFGIAISKIRKAVTATYFTNTNVGLVLNDDIYTYASIIALWLEGCSYVPLHPDWPLERCLDIIKQVNIDLLLDSSCRSRYDSNVLKTSGLEYHSDNLNLNYSATISEEALAYILFTSGSTGKPKGVQISRKNIGAFMDSFWDTGIVINENDRCLQCFDLTFDVSVQSYLVPLTKGACCYTIPHGQIKYIYAAGLIEDHRLTFVAIAPSMARLLKPYFDEVDFSSLKYTIFTAEACPLSLVEEWRTVAPKAEVFDFYGPTESTIYCTYYRLSNVSENKTYNGMISIGKPMKNVISIIIDENGNILPRCTKGELCIAGPQVTPGYLNNPEKNAEAFFEKEIDGKTKRFYHTGDLCFEDKDDNIMYSGRIDQQAKIQGYRVEMGEIEFFAREFLDGKNTVCIAFENDKKITEIAIFIESTEFDTAAMFDYLKSKIPNYMIPRYIYFEPTFPLNSNAKIDKAVLKSKIQA